MWWCFFQAGQHRRQNHNEVQNGEGRVLQPTPRQKVATLRVLGKRMEGTAASTNKPLAIKDEDVWELYRDGAGYLTSSSPILSDKSLVDMRAALNRVSATKFLFNDTGVEEIEEPQQGSNPG